jgi:RNA polymerase sigma factor (sigma-70 family)
LTEHDLISGCREGDARCQRELVKRYAPALFTVARRYAGDLHTAEDVLQEAFIKIFSALFRYESRGSFEGWMRRIVVNTALSYIDRSCLRYEMSVCTLEANDSTPPDVYAQLGAEELLQLISNLPEGFRQIFNLFVMEQYSHSEIAALLDIAESTSRSQLMRAKRMLRCMIAENEKIRI